MLRVEGTTNSKSGELVRTVYIQTDDNGEPVKYSFEYLCEWALPIDRQKITNERKERKDRQHQRQLRLVSSSKKPLIPGNKGPSGRQLAWDRLNDLRKLFSLRGGVQPGQRMLVLFWQINFMLLSGSTHSRMMQADARELARQIDLRWRWSDNDLSKLLDKAKQFEAGEGVELGGRIYPPLYTPKNGYLIDLFSISLDEQRQMKTIISPAMARERDKVRKAAFRLAAGATPRNTSKTRLKPWLELGMSERTWYRKGQPVVSEDEQVLMVG